MNKLIAGLSLAVALIVAPFAANAGHYGHRGHVVKRVIVEHHYPYGVNKYSRHGRSVYRQGYHNPSTCYRNCFHQGRSVHRGHGYRHRGHRGHRGGSNITFGISGGSGHRGGFQTFHFGISSHR